MIKHVCIRTEAAHGDNQLYVAGKNQPENGDREMYGTFFDDIEDAQDLCKRMRARWPKEKFEVFSLVQR